MNESYNTLKQKATDLRKQGNLSAALEEYQTLYQNHRDVCNEWDLWGYAFCLRKLARSQEALGICRETYRKYADFEHIKSLYAWCIYDTEIKKASEDIQANERVFFKAASGILQLTCQDQYSPYVRTIFKVLSYLDAKPTFPAEEILDWSSKLEPTALSTDCFSFETDEGKYREKMSDQEKWYTLRSKALEKIGQYEKCISLCTEALKCIPKFHSDNDVWLKRRIALSKWHLGQQESALSELQNLLISKKEWFIEFEIAQIYFELEKLSDALFHAASAALNSGEPEYKCELYVFIGEISAKQGNLEIASKHFLLSIKLRENRDWKIPPKLNDWVRKLNIDTQTDISLMGLQKELRKYWESVKFSNQPLLNGIVKKILPHGKAGFIASENGKQYYFSIKAFKGSSYRLKEDLKVVFHTEKSFDPKKQQETEVAVNIQEKSEMSSIEI